MAQIDGLGSAIALKSSDLFMVNQNVSNDVPEVRLEKKLTLSDLMAYINTNFDPTNNTNSSYFNKMETISGTCAISAGPSGFSYSGNRYVDISNISEPVLIRVSLSTTGQSGYTFYASGVLMRGGYSVQRTDSANFTFIGVGGLSIGVYSSDPSAYTPHPVLDMMSLYASPGTISYSVEVYHSKSSRIALSLLDASITPAGRLPIYPVLSSTRKTTIDYPGTLPQSPDSDTVYML